jgi:uncharacterized protein (DUF58 family)
MRGKNRVRFTVHRSGKIYIFIAIVLGILALNGGNNFHYLAAASVLGYMAASGEAGKINIKGADVSLSFPDEIYADTPFFVTVEVKNTKKFSSISLLDVTIRGASAIFPLILPGAKRTAMLEMSLPRRGVNEIGEIKISSVYPFCLFTCNLVVPYPASLTVFPKPLVAGESARLASMIDEEELALETTSQSVRQALLSDSDMIGVRPYAEGDSMRQIHWKSSARTGTLKSRLYDSPAGGKIIDLDRLSEGGMEMGLSYASGEIRESIMSGDSIGLLSRGKLLAVSDARPDKLSMLTTLALHE